MKMEDLFAGVVHRSPVQRRVRSVACRKLPNPSKSPSVSSVRPFPLFEFLDFGPSMGRVCRRELACELQRQSVDYMLVERTPQRSYFCKALGVTPRTLEIFEALGVVGEAIDCGVWLAGWTAFENGVETGSQDRQAEGFPYGFLAVPQYETERILESCLHRHGGVTWRGLTFTDFTDGTDSVKALPKQSSTALLA